MNEQVIFNFSLLFDESFSNDLVEYSQKLRNYETLDYVLGPNSLPHVTILQFPGLRAEAESYWGTLSSIDLPKIHLNFHGMAFDRWRTWDVLWLRVKFCEELRIVQRHAIERLGPLDYVNGIGDMYEPHATLATWPTKTHLPAFPIASKIIDRKHIPASYTLGVSGPCFQYAKKLFPAS